MAWQRRFLGGFSSEGPSRSYIGTMALEGTSPLVKLAREDPVPSSSHAYMEGIWYSPTLYRKTPACTYAQAHTAPEPGVRCGRRMSGLWLARRKWNASGLVGRIADAHAPPLRNVRGHSNNHTHMRRAQRGGASKLRSAVAEGLRIRGAAPARDRTRWGDDQTACGHRQGTGVEGAQGGIGRYGTELTLAVCVNLAASVCSASSIHPVDTEAWAVDQGVPASGCGYGWRAWRG